MAVQTLKAEVLHIKNIMSKKGQAWRIVTMQVDGEVGKILVPGDTKVNDGDNVDLEVNVRPDQQGNLTGRVSIVPKAVK